MTKFKGYQSPIVFLARKIGFVERKVEFYYEHNSFDRPLFSDDLDPRKEDSELSLMWGGLNPFITMKKDFVDTFKPYPSIHFFYKDLLLPARGVGNLIKGVSYLVLSPIIFLLNTCRYAYVVVETKLALDAENTKIPFKTIFKERFVDNMKINTARSAGGFIDGIGSIIQGATQIFATPFLLLRVPLRGILTRFLDTSLAAELKSRASKLAKLIQKDEKTLDDAVKIDSEMKRLGKKVYWRNESGQTLGFAKEQFAESFLKCGKLTEEKTAVTGNKYFVVKDSQYKRKAALHCLSFFTCYGDKLSEKSALVRPEPVNPDASLIRWNLATERSYQPKR